MKNADSPSIATVQGTVLSRSSENSSAENSSADSSSHTRTDTPTDINARSDNSTRNDNSAEESQFTPAEAGNLKKAIRRAAMDLLARREHSAHELNQKLSRRFSSPELIQLAITRLADEGLQSDERFAESFLRYRSLRGQGPLRLRQELLSRGVSDRLVSQTLADCAIDWYQLAEHTYHKKYSDAPALEPKERAKRIRFMLYRGFDREHFEAFL